MAPLKILLTGATGYIGGSILSHIVQSPIPILQESTITCLVRGEERVQKLKSQYGERVNPVLFKDLDDIDRITEVASQHDITINTTTGYHSDSVTAVTRGLAKRKDLTGTDTFLIHTSGTSNLSNYPVSKLYTESPPNREFDDATDDVYTYEKAREAAIPYAQRTAELAAIDTGLATGVKVLVIMSPTIYGTGTGLFNTNSIQIPTYARAILAAGHGFIVGDGAGVWDHVHVDDLAALYTLVLADILQHAGAHLAFGPRGIMFSGVGRHQWKDVPESLTHAAHAAGLLTSTHLKPVTLQEAAALTGLDEQLFELALLSTSRTNATKARTLGWKPTRGAADWARGFVDEIAAAQKHPATT